MGYTVIVKSGTIVETYEYEKNLHRPKYRKPKQRSRPVQAIVRRGDHARAAQRRFRRLVQANLAGTENPALLTLTFVQPVGYLASQRALHAWLQGIRRRVGAGFKYVAVPEYQKRGAIHYHVIAWGIPHEIIAEERATRRLQSTWLRGFVDCIPTDGHPRIAGYLTKYLSKGMQDTRIGYKKAYFASRNVLRPMRFGVDLELGEMVELGFVEAPPPPAKSQIRGFSTLFLGKCTYRRYDTKKAPAG